jgi:hypothetical protein
MHVGDNIHDGTISQGAGKVNDRAAKGAEGTGCEHNKAICTAQSATICGNLRLFESTSAFSKLEVIFCVFWQKVTSLTQLSCLSGFDMW